MTALGVWRLLRMAAVMVGCVIGWGLARPFGRQSFWVQLFLRRIGYIAGVRTTIVGTPLPRHVLYVANHISWLDILALGGATRTRFVAKADIADWTLVGWLTTIGGSLYVRRERPTETRAQATAVAVALGEDRPVTLFAEGGTGDGTVLLPFRAPLFVAPVEAGAMVQPVAIDYGPARSRFAWGDTPLAEEMKKLVNRRELVPVTLRFLEPLDARTLDRKTLAARAHAAVAAALT